MLPNTQFYRRNLPHIHPDGYPLFIIFRLANSLPVEVLAKLKRRMEDELKTLRDNAVLDRYRVKKKYFDRYDNWLARCEYGPRWLEQADIALIVADKMHALAEAEDRYQLLAYCIMPNHVHLLIKSHITREPAEHQGKTAKYPVTDTLRLLKGSTARHCNQALHREGAFWHHESYDHYARDEDELERIIRYIQNNPIKAGLVDDWRKWSFTYVNPELGAW